MHRLCPANMRVFVARRLEQTLSPTLCSIEHVRDAADWLKLNFELRKTNASLRLAHSVLESCAVRIAVRLLCYTLIRDISG